MAEYVNVTGLADAKRAIEELTRDLRRKVVRSALREAARPIVQQAKSNAPVRTGLVRRRIGVFASRIKRGQNGEIGVYIKPRATAAARRNKSLGGDPFYYRFQEAGYHAVGTRRVSGGRRNRVIRLAERRAKFIQGKAFMGRAFESRSRDALAIFTTAINRRIEQANRRI